MKKILGITLLLVAVCVFTTIFEGVFVNSGNVENLMQRTALFGFISIGVAFVIITGGIDLSIGSVIVLTSCLVPMLLKAEFEQSGQEFSVREVDTDENRVTVTGNLDDVDKNDRFTFTSRNGTDLSLTVVSSKSGDNGEAASFRVREYPSDLEPGMRVQLEKIKHMPVWLVFSFVLLIALAIGLLHGLLITKLRLQPFVVTLCGLLIYRGLARFLAQDTNQGLGTAFAGVRDLVKGKIIHLPMPCIGWISGGETNAPSDSGLYGVLNPVVETLGGQWIGITSAMFMLLIAAIAAAAFLNKTIYGRYLLALGRNEEAARYSGINTDRMKIIAYMICAGLAGFTGILFALDLNSIQPSTHANFYELYAIAAAVLGGCSLRGGEGSIIGVIIGAAIMRVLYNSIMLIDWIDQKLEFVVIGVVLLVGVMADELAKRVAAKRRAYLESADSPDPQDHST